MMVLLHWSLHPWPDPASGRVIFFDLPGEHMIFSTLAEASGYAIFDPTLRLVFGCLELLAVVLLLVPPFRKWGAWLALVCFSLLIGAHLSPWLGVELPDPNMPGETDSGSAFYLTIACFTAAILLLAVHPSKR